MFIYRRVVEYYRSFAAGTLIGIAFSLASIGLNLLKPWPFKVIVDYILPGRLRDFHPPPIFERTLHFADAALTKSDQLSSTHLIALLCLALVLIQFLWGLCNFASNYVFVKIGLQALLKLRTDLYSHLQRLSLKFHDTRRSSDSSFRVAYDSQAIQTIYNKGFTGIFGSVITLIGTFAIMVQLDWVLTLLSLAIVPLIVGTIYFFARRIGRGAMSGPEQSVSARDD